MSRRSKLLLALGATLVLAAFLFRRPAPSYNELSIDEWFKRYTAARLSNSTQPIAPVGEAFKAMGTNAVPYLVKRINRRQGYTRLSLLCAKYSGNIPKFLTPLLPLYPGKKFAQGMDAAELLATQVKPPGQLLLPLMTPALNSSNSNQRCMAFAALRGITSEYELARPHLVSGLKDPDARVQKFAAMAIRWHGPHGKWAVTNLLEAARTTDLDVLDLALQALNSLGTNSLPILSALSEMRTAETNETRRQILTESIDHISKSRPGH